MVEFNPDELDNLIKTQENMAKALEKLGKASNWMQEAQHYNDLADRPAPTRKTGKTSHIYPTKPLSEKEMLKIMAREDAGENIKIHKPSEKSEKWEAHKKTQDSIASSQEKEAGLAQNLNTLMALSILKMAAQIGNSYGAGGPSSYGQGAQTYERVQTQMLTQQTGMISRIGGNAAQFWDWAIGNRF